MYGVAKYTANTQVWVSLIIWTVVLREQKTMAQQIFALWREEKQKQHWGKIIIVHGVD